MKTYATVSTRKFWILPLHTTVHSFLMYTFILCVHICFTTFKIAIKANWNIYYNISNVSTTLNLSKMKRISGSHYFLDLFKNPTNCYLLLRCAHLREWKLVFCSMFRRIYVRRIYSLNAKDLKFDWSIQITGRQRTYSLVQQHESWQLLQLLSFLISVGADALFSRNRLLLHYFESLMTGTCRSTSK